MESQDTQYIPKAIVVLSGGLDSTTALYWAMQQYEVVGAISFNYGQKHARELEYAQDTITRINAERVKDGKDKIMHRIQAVNISSDRSSLVADDKETPHGHYTEDSMKITVVNNRNSIMFSLATAWAIDLKADRVIVGIHAGDHAVYPDCRPEYIRAFNKTMGLANEGFINEGFRVEAPFVDITKSDIAELFLLLGGDESHTYSDYEGGEVQKGRSGTAVERIEAISDAYDRINELTRPYTEAHKQDRTQYEEKEFALNLLIERAKETRLKDLLQVIERNNEKNYEQRGSVMTVNYDPRFEEIGLAKETACVEYNDDYEDCTD